MFHCDSECFLYRTYSVVPISSSSQTPYNIKGGEVSRHSPSYQTSLPRVQRLTIHTTQREVSVRLPVAHPSEREETIRSCSGDASGCIGSQREPWDSKRKYNTGKCHSHPLVPWAGLVPAVRTHGLDRKVHGERGIRSDDP